MIKLRTENDPLNAVYENREYKEICKEQVLLFPLILDVEISGRCNLNCIMCARQIKVDRILSDMEEELFHKIVDQAAQYGAKLIRFSGYGEALMHKKFIAFLRYAKGKSLLTHLTTNGHLLNKELCREIVTVPLDKIKFSFQGTDEKEYCRMRATKDYDRLVNNIIMLKKIRSDLGSQLPIIQVATTVLDETPEQIKEFHDRWTPIADNVYDLRTAVGRLENTQFGKQNGHRSKAKILDTMCMEVRTKMSIWNDGKVSGCCGDHLHQLLLGDIKENTLKEMWDDKPARELRRLLEQKNPVDFTEEEKKRFPLCAGCAYPFGYDEGRE